MEDSNTIAWLSPTEPEHKDIDTWKAIRMNISEDIPPQVSGYRSRESTAPLEDEEDNNPEHTSYPQLHLAFNSGLKCGHGLMFGTDPNSCDVVLPRLRRISNRHCYLTFDAERRLILRDCSTYGTIVKYDEQGRELRRHFTWILGGHKVPQNTKNIIIEIQGVSFRIDVLRYDVDPDQYNANIDRFLEKADEPHLNGLGIYNPTAPSSQSHTPTQGPIRIKRETLGKGAFAVVRRFWDVSTGLEYAYKEPLNKRKFDKKLWEKEAEIMGQISHDHIVRLEEFVSKPSPRLVLEYVPFGTLEGLELSLEQSMTILYQGLSALADLHGRKIPIVHRDIKPGNILLQSRDPPFIKFADFGLSKASDNLKTFCGTRLYLAPEVYQRKKYTPAVDIWSFGLVVYQCAFGSLPSEKNYQGEAWCEFLVVQVNDWEEGDLINLLSSTMIIMDPKLRRSAQHCYREASRLIASYERCLTPTPTSYGYKPVTCYATEGQAVRGVNLHTSSNVQNYSQHKDSTRAFYPSDCNGRYIRPDAPPSSSTNSLQHVQSVPGIDLFGENWLQDPNCVGPSVAAMGQESSDLESWDRWSAASDQRPFGPVDHSTSPFHHSSVRHIMSDAPSPPSRVPTIPVDSGSNLQREESVPGIDLFGQNWLQDPNCVGSTVAAMEQESHSELSSWESWPSATSVPRTIPQSVGKQNDDDDYSHQGQEHLAQNSYVIDTGHQHYAHQSEISPAQNESVINTRHQERAETAWTSEEYIAARLLQGMHAEGLI